MTMRPARLRQCLQLVHWPTTTLADVLQCDAGTVLAWYHGTEDMPEAVAAWIAALAKAHEDQPAPLEWQNSAGAVIEFPEIMVDTPQRGRLK